MRNESTPDARAVHVPSAAAALGSLLLGGWLSWHHPLAPTLVAAAFALCCVLAYLQPRAWLFVVPALLPVIDLAPWTGWMIVEEFDILVLGAAAGGYASMALRHRVLGDATTLAPAPPVVAQSEDRVQAAPAIERAPVGMAALVLIGLFGVWTALGILRGFNAAGSTELGWFDGYYAASNSLRVAKSYLLAMLMLPPLLVEMRRSCPSATGVLSAGLVAGLCLASLAVLWERLAFPGLLNFSSDYRVTALFWEMHVGGAALDGFLALTFPFAVRELFAANTGTRKSLAALGLLLATYACLTTFSRGVYLAVPASVGLLAVLLFAKGTARSLPSAVLAVLKSCALMAVMFVLFHWVFRAGGYRSLLAVLGAFALMLPLGNTARLIPARARAAGLAAGAIAGAAGSVMALLLFKGIYVNFALAFSSCALLLFLAQRSTRMAPRIGALAAYVWLILAAAGVALGWGGESALRDSAIVLSLLMALTIWNATADAPLWPRDLPLQGAIVGLAVLVAVTAAVFSGGAYMAERFSSSERDVGGRLQHWRDGIGMLHTPSDWLLGKGAGRFPQDYLFQLVGREFPGSSTIGTQRGESYLVLAGPRHEVGFGEMFRVAQRVTISPGAPFAVVLDARAESNSRLHLELCERNLLYVEECATSAVTIPATGESWQHRTASLDGAKLTGGAWYAPRPVFLAVAAENPGSRIEIDNISLIGPDGRDLLINGNFSRDMTGWFTTSDRFHLPWHIKNLGLNVLFDQGAVGLLLFLTLTGCALFRMVVGAARVHPFAPFLAAALAGFLLVGLFDSLLDVPRLAFLFYLLTFVALLLRPGTSAGHSGPATRAEAAKPYRSSEKLYRAAALASS